MMCEREMANSPHDICTPGLKTKRERKKENAEWVPEIDDVFGRVVIWKFLEMKMRYNIPEVSGYGDVIVNGKYETDYNNAEYTIMRRCDIQFSVLILVHCL